MTCETPRMLFGFLRRGVAALALLLAGATVVNADTLMMPKRDGMVGQSMIVWGITTLPNTVTGNTTTYTFNFGDGTAEVTGNVGATAPALERSYINVGHVFPNPGTFTVTMTITNQQQGTEVATVEVRIIDPADLTGPGTKTSPVGAHSNELYRKLRINMAIQDGLRFLWQAQNRRALDLGLPTTSWNALSHYTAMVVAAFENHGYRLANDGSAPTGVYEKYIVQRGLNFVVNALTVQAISVNNTAVLPNQPAPRDPCVGIPADQSPCSGLTNPSGSAGYTIGISMMPFAASSALDRVNGAFGPALIRNKTYREILQRLTNTLSWGQYDGNNLSRGGWGYGMQSGTQDGSVMGWVILGLLDAESVGIEVPDWVKTEAAFSITAGWNNNGSWDYNPNGPTVQGSFTGMAKAGIPLQGMFMTGEVGGSRVDTTVGYISDRWNAPGRVPPDTQTALCGQNQNFGCSYAMFNNFKGLQLQNVRSFAGVNRSAGPGAIVENDWLAHYEDWFVNNQVNAQANNGGHWNMRFSPHGNNTNGNVAIAELILSGVALVLPDGDKFATVGLSPALASATEGGTHTVIAKAESTDGAPVPGATVNFTILSGPNANLSFQAATNADGEATFTYTDAGPMPSFGTDRLQASIGTLTSNIAEMIWLPFNRPPVANPNAYTVDEDTVLSGNVITDAPADTDLDGDALTAAVVAGPANGALVFNNDGSFAYTPAPNFCGSDSFTYDLHDGEESSNVAAVSIAVTCVNDAPVAGDDTNATAEDTPVGGSVSGNDTDVDGDALTFSNASDPAKGSVTLNPDGGYTYTPDANFCGSDSFTYDASDGTVADSATVTVNVSCVNDAPAANDDANSTNEDTPVDGSVAGNDTDPDGDSLTFGNASDPANGSVTLNPDGSYTYTPDANFCGADSFTYDASDGSVADSGTVTIAVACANDAPVAGDGSATTAEDTPYSGAVVSTDVDGGAPSYAVVSGPAHGTLVLNGDGTYVYSPNPNYNGPDSFTFSVSDGNGGTDTGEVSITVTPVNDAPVCTAAAPDIASLWPPNHQLVAIRVLGVTDPVEGSAITIEVTDIFQDEPTNTIGDGNTPIDGFGVGTSTAQVRAERSGSKRVPGDGRMYYISFTGTDAEGGECTGTVRVGVPHDLGQDSAIGAGGPLYRSTGQ